MSEKDPGAGAVGGGGAAGAGDQPSDEEMQRQLEEQLRQVRVQDLVLESVATIVNLTMRRIANEGERDLEQARIGIEAVRAMVGLLDAQAQSQVRQALSQLQVHYAQAAGAGGGDSPPEDPSPGGREPSQPADGGSTAQPASSQPGASPPGGGRRRGNEPPPRLWTPPGAD